MFPTRGDSADILNDDPFARSDTFDVQWMLDNTMGPNGPYVELVRLVVHPKETTDDLSC